MRRLDGGIFGRLSVSSVPMIKMFTYMDEADGYGDEEREPSALADAVVALPN